MDQMSSLGRQTFMRGLPQWFLFAGLVAVSLVPQGVAQLVNATPLFISLEDVPSLGDANARIAIVEFADYQCPYCVAYANNMLPQIISDYVKTGKVRYFFKDLPIEILHPDAFKAAEAARCAGEQDKYWEMHNRLFKSVQALGVNEMPGHARMLGLDVPDFKQCLDSGRYASQIRKDIQDSKKYGVQGTPTFFIGPLDTPQARMKPFKKIEGTQLYVAFQQALDPLLSPAGEEKY